MRILIKMKMNDIPIRISVLGQIVSMPPPFNITVLLISINHLGGIRFATICSGTGIFLTGKINPESSILGSMRTNPDIARAVS